MARGFISFFSGALGLDLGLESAGLRPLALNETDTACLQTIRANRPDVPLYVCDVRLLDAARLCSDLRIDDQSLFAVVGGPPCQAFSTAGRRRGLQDERGNVFLHFVRLATALRPRYIAIENVRGLLSAPLRHRPHAERGERQLEEDEHPGGALHQVVTMLEREGYTVSFDLYNVANFGVPQSRERLVLLAALGDRRVPHLVPTHDDQGRKGLERWTTFQEAVADMSDIGPCAPLRPGRKKFVRRLSAGQNWRDLPVRMQKEALGNAYGSTGGRVGFCRRLAWDRPSPTLMTSPTMPATELSHPEQHRPLSVNEYKRLQTFPDDWIVCGSLAQQYRQIGNAVPVLFGEAVGRHLLAFDRGELRNSAPTIPTSRYKNTDEASWRILLSSKN
ncbi:MAG: DNA cytosine methyltransferase [Armatimonadetes bacterium]|nr:DNA cytosine methyltransferase [Armatimonadota bacterium]